MDVKTTGIQQNIEHINDKKEMSGNYKSTLGNRKNNNMKRIITQEVKKHRKRKGVHAKSKTSKNKKSPNYKKPYRGQGR